MRFSKILCPTDFSEGSRQAMGVAVRLANEQNAELVIVHALRVRPFAFAGGEGFSPQLSELMTKDADSGLQVAAREAIASGVARVSTRLLSGAGWREMVGLIDSQAFDLVVLGTHGRTGLSRVLLGSVAEKMVRHAPCSTLVVRPDREPTPFQSVLCPIDFGEGTQEVIDVASEWVRPGGAGITLLHVIDAPVAYTGEIALSDFVRDLEQHSMDELEIWAKQLRNSVSVPVTILSRLGPPGAETLRVLDEDPTIDIVVMGSHRRTGIKRALLGSVAEKVVRHASCPVLVARHCA